MTIISWCFEGQIRPWRHLAAINILFVCSKIFLFVLQKYFSDFLKYFLFSLNTLQSITLTRVKPPSCRGFFVFLVAVSGNGKEHFKTSFLHFDSDKFLVSSADAWEIWFNRLEDYLPFYLNGLKRWTICLFTHRNHQF